MCLKQLSKKFIVWLLIISVLFVYIEQPVKVYAEPVTLASAWGGTAIAKEVLSMVIALYGMGVTLSTNQSALDLYNELKVSNPNLLSDMISVQPQIWQGAKSEILEDLQGVKTGISTWLTGLFGSLETGINAVYDTTATTSGTYNLGSWQGTNFHNKTVYYTKNGVTYKFNLKLWWYNSSYVLAYETLSGQTAIKLHGISDSNNYEIKIINGIWAVYINESQYPGIYEAINTNDVPTVGTIPSSVSATITADSPLFNEDWTVESDDKFPMPPLWLPQKAGDLPLKQSISAEGIEQTLYDGSIDDYTNDIVNNATWDDVWGYTQGISSTATLTPTAEGLLVGDVGVGTGAIPYPEVGTYVPTDTLTGIGVITGLLQSIINWIYQFMQIIANLFIISDGYLVDKLGGLRNSLESKFNYTGWLGLLSGLGQISSKGIPDLVYQGNIILDGSIPNEIASYIKTWLRGILWILIVLYNLNQLYKLVRGTDYVWDRGRTGQ